MKRKIAKVLLFINLMGILLTFVFYLVMVIRNGNLYDGFGIFVLGLPFVVIGWIYGIYKSIKARYGTKYGIRFWGAIKNAPKWMCISLAVLFPISIISGVIVPSFGIYTILPMFEYTAFLIFLSGILEDSLRSRHL